MKVRLASAKEWCDFVDSNENATFFHTIDWYKIWHSYNGGTYKAVLFEFKSGSQVLLPLAFRKTHKGLFNKYLSSPAGTYGGFLAKNRLSNFERDELVNWIRRFHAIDITLTPFHGSNWKSYATTTDFTQMIDLSDSWESIESQMSKGHITRKVRMAERNQLEVKRLESREIPLFHEIYLSRRKAWKSPTNYYQLELFELVDRASNAEFWGIYLPTGGLIGGGIFLRHKKHVSSWLPVVLTKYLQLKPYELLFFRCLQYYHGERLEWFDFNPSGGHEGVVRFKAGFGARKVDVLNFSFRSLTFKGVSHLVKLKGRIW